MVEEIKVFTDGSCMKDSKGKVRGGTGGYFPSFPSWNFSKQMRGKGITNQRAELKACIEAISKVKKERKEKAYLLHIYTDSMCTLKIATVWGKQWKTNKWKRGAKKEGISNLTLVKKLVGLAETSPLKFTHVRSHQREPKLKTSQAWFLWKGNKEADRLATAYCKKKKD